MKRGYFAIFALLLVLLFAGHNQIFSNGDGDEPITEMPPQTGWVYGTIQ